jgi:hypothetical protein
MTEKITIMLSSTISDMKAERDAIMQLFSKYPFVKLLGTDPIQKSYPSNPHIQTLELAESCDFYILLLGKRYGFEIKEGLSATEAEFDRAVKSNPTKVLVFRNISISPDTKQKKFIKKVGDYYKGYWISDFEYTHTLQEIVEKSFLALLKDRASIGKKISYIDHFVRMAIQRFPTQDATVHYSVTKDFVQFTYELYGKIHCHQFDRLRISTNFWGCISELEDQFAKWV